GLIVAALQVVASLLERRLHGKLAAQFAFGIRAESPTGPDRQRKEGAGAQRHKKAVADHDSILAAGRKRLRARASSARTPPRGWHLARRTKIAGRIER